MRDAWHACVFERQWGCMRGSVDRMMPHLCSVHSLSLLRATHDLDGHSNIGATGVVVPMAYKTGSVTPTRHARWAKMRSRAQRQAGLSHKSPCHSKGLASFDSMPQMSNQRRQIDAWLTDNNRAEQDKVQR